MGVNEKEIHYLEEICKNDKRYRDWIGHHMFESNGYDVPHPAVVWTEAAILVMVMKDVKMDCRYVFKTWNNGKSNEEAYFVKKTALHLLNNGDREFCYVSDDDIRWLRRDVSDYLFYGRLRRRKTQHVDMEVCSYEEKEEDEEGFLVAEPMEDKKELALPRIRSMKRTISDIIDICPNDLLGISATMNLVIYYNNVTNGKLKEEVEMIRMMMNNQSGATAWLSANKDIECRFSEEQVRTSGVKGEAKIVLATIDYMLNGKYRKENMGYCKFDDFAIGVYAAMSHEGYWNGTRENFANMMKRLFDADVKMGMVSRWIQRNSDNYRQWQGESNSIAGRRRIIACDFCRLIKELKELKVRNI